MNSDAIEQLIIHSERSLQWRLSTVPLCGWILSLSLILLGIFSFHPLESLVFAAPAALFSFCATLSFVEQWHEVRRHRAAAIWQHLRKNVFEKFNASTEILAADIATFYRADPRGEVLLLPQALRLLDTHHKQQQRLNSMTTQLREFYSVGVALRQKTAQLRELGESHPQGEARLQTLSEDEAALRTMSGQIEASCRRLEMILLEARTAQQTRQLHREISDLTLERPSVLNNSLSLDSSDALRDIEHQITREVETFLQLERETDRHLRDI